MAAGHNDRVAVLRSHIVHDSKKSIPVMLSVTAVLLQDLTGEDYSSDVPEVFEHLETDFSERERQMLAGDFEREVAEFIRKRYSFSNIQVSHRPRYVDDGEIDVWATKQDGNKHIVWIVECKLRWPPYPKTIQPTYVSQLKKYERLVCKAEGLYAQENNWVLDVSAILATNGQDRSEITTEMAKENHVEIWDFAIPARRLTARIDLTKCDMKRIY